MSDKLTSKSGPIPPEHWDGEPSPVIRTPAAQAQEDRELAEFVARARATQAQPQQQPTTPQAKPTKPA
jgi:hypothetical protein